MSIVGPDFGTKVDELDVARNLLSTGNLDRALVLCQQFLAAHPDSGEAWLLQARIFQQTKRFPDLLVSLLNAHKLAPHDLSLRVHLVESLVFCGQVAAAKSHLADFEQSLLMPQGHFAASTLQWTVLSRLYTQCSDYTSAVRCSQVALDLDPSDMALCYNLASALFALGDMVRSESLLDQVIAKNPQDTDACYLRATLRKQGASNHHIEPMQKLLDSSILATPLKIPLLYALGKELEDIGEYERAFHAIDSGARLQRQQLSYRVESDLQVMEQLRQKYTTDSLVRRGHAFESIDSSRLAILDAKSVSRIFVVGLPRSGTTLVDRILSAHSAVASLGEIRDLIFAFTRVVGQKSMEIVAGRPTEQADYVRIGEEYILSTEGYGYRENWLVDKTPLNCLYLGPIHLALPKAKIIHVRRDPLDSCFALYKTLFRGGCPFSYDFDDLARYYAAYEKLMCHWRNVLPDGFIDIDYESIVFNQEFETRRILDYCALPWQDQCLSFHKSDKPSATASGAQVRTALYSSSVNSWRRYARHLMPLRDALKRQGVSCD